MGGRWRWGIALVGAVGLALAGCGSDDDSDARKKGSEPATTTTKAESRELGVPQIDIDNELAVWVRDNRSGTGGLEVFEGDPMGSYLGALGYALEMSDTQSIVSAVYGEHDFGSYSRVEAFFIADAAGEDSGYGVACRMQDDHNYYAFGVGNDGTYAIEAVVDGDPTVLTGEGEWQTSDLLSTPEARGGQVTASCAGSDLTLYVNGDEIDSVSDDTFTDGGVGVYLETFESGDASVLISDFTALGVFDTSVIDDGTIEDWTDFTTATPADVTLCELGDPAESGVKPKPVFVTQCNDVVYTQMKNGFQADELFEATVEGVEFDSARRFPDCTTGGHQRGVLTAEDGGDIACVQLEDDVVAIVWWTDAGQLGYYRADTTDPDFADTWGEDVWPLTVGLAAAEE